MKDLLQKIKESGISVCTIDIPKKELSKEMKQFIINYKQIKEKGSIYPKNTILD